MAQRPEQGLILQHPLFEKLLEEQQECPERCETYRLEDGELPDTHAKPKRTTSIRWPRIRKGKEYDKHWLAEAASVAFATATPAGWSSCRSRTTRAIGRTLERLKRSLFAGSLMAGGLIAILSTVLWAIGIRALGEPTRRVVKPATVGEEPKT